MQREAAQKLTANLLPEEYSFSQVMQRSERPTIPRIGRRCEIDCEWLAFCSRDGEDRLGRTFWQTFDSGVASSAGSPAEK